MAAEGNPAVQMVLPMAEMIGWLRNGVGELIRQAGLQLISLMMEEEVRERVGDRSRPNAGRTMNRWGKERGYCVVMGQKVPIERPRVRTTEDREVRLAHAAQDGTTVSPEAAMVAVPPARMHANALNGSSPGTRNEKSVPAGSTRQSPASTGRCSAEVTTTARPATHRKTSSQSMWWSGLVDDPGLMSIRHKHSSVDPREGAA